MVWNAPSGDSLNCISAGADDEAYAASAVSQRYVHANINYLPLVWICAHGMCPMQFCVGYSLGMKAYWKKYNI